MKSKSFDKMLYVREELNGVSVYDQAKDYISFYEGLKYSNIEIIDDTEEVRNFLAAHSEKLSTNLNFQAPLKVNWLISNTCNLDCVYCFADDKCKLNQELTNKKPDIDAAINSIKSTKPLLLGLSGGEPTLFPELCRVIQKVSDYCSVILDTNGSVEFSEDLQRAIKESNVRVRVSLDSLNPHIVNMLRPHKHTNKEYLAQVINNIKKLADENLTIHTVVTQRNIYALHDLGKQLIELGANRWHLYGVSNSKKCHDFYKELKVSENELYAEYNKLKKNFCDKIKISCYFDENNLANDMILMIDNRGRFFVDSTESGITYVGKNSQNPTHAEVTATMDIERHCKAYLSLALQDR